MSDRMYNIALLSNFTIKGLDAHLQRAAERCGIAISVYNGEYSQWQQEILGEKLYIFNPDMVFVIVDFEDIVSQMNLIEQLAIKMPAKIIICNQVSDSSAGLGDDRDLAERFKGSGQIMVFDFDSWLINIGKKEHWNTKYRELGDLRLHPNAFMPLARELAAYLIPLAGKTKKCLVLDLDNTLWDGVIGEDGLDGITPFYELQKLIKELNERGAILAINSSNNIADVAEVFVRQKNMLLRREDFAAERINWKNKAENIRELAQELNIGLDSMVFVDDDPRNRQLIREAVPEVEVLEPLALADYKGFMSFGVTVEDRKRTVLYAAEKKRKQLKEVFIDLDSFLRRLELAIAIRPVSSAHLPRAAQLTQKTNQFNLTTRRYQEENIKNMLASGAKAWILDVQDKFGDYGLTGLIIIVDEGPCWEIDTFLMSCRVLGKRVEEEFFGRVLGELKQQNPKRIIGAYIPTAKNEQVKDFYQKFGFTKRESEGIDVWEQDLRHFNFVPLDFIKTIIISDTKYDQ